MDPLLLKLLPQSHIQELDLASLLSETYLQALKKSTMLIGKYRSILNFVLFYYIEYMHNIYSGKQAPSSSGHSDSDPVLFELKKKGQNKAEKFFLSHLHCHLQNSIYMKV